MITFESVHYVMKAEKLLRENGFNIKLIPTPREVSSDCGTAIEIFEEPIAMIKELLKKNNLFPDGFYKK